MDSTTQSSGGRPVRQLAFILDDEREICALLGRLLKNLGFSTHEFNRAEDLASALKHSIPDVIFLDLSLGQSDAIEVMRDLAKSEFRGDVVLMSGRHDTGTMDQVHTIGKRYGFVMLPYLRKPFHVEELKARLELLAPPSTPDPDCSDLEEALRNRWLELWYQPKIDLKTRLAYGAEALIRLRHPERGILMPMTFLPPAGDPLHRPLAEFVLSRALADWPQLAGERFKMKLAVNMPVSVFESDEFVATVRKYLPRQPSFAGLVIELTEDEVIQDPEFAREIATQLRLYDIQISIDDFGKGHSTLERIKQLPFVELKIDREYVHGCSTSRKKYELCESIVVLAHRHGMTTVAEGVESERDARALMRMQCDGAQGYFFAKPMEPREFSTALMTRAVSSQRAEGDLASSFYRN